MQDANSDMTRKINNSYLLGQSNAPTTGADMLKIRTDGTLVWEEVDGTGYLPPTWNGGRGLVGGGNSGAGTLASIDYIAIASLSNASDFGDLYTARENKGALSNGSRGVWAGGEYDRTIEYVTISTLSDSTDFGDLTAEFVTPRYDVKGCCNGTRGLWQAGRYAVADSPICYITVASTGDAINFGDLLVDKQGAAALGDATRACFGGGQSGTSPVVRALGIDYVAYDTTGDAADFGDITVARPKLNGMSDTTRGIFSDGEAGNTSISTIDYITIQSTGNATNFGDRTAVDMYASGDCSNGTRGVMMGGTGDAGGANVMDYITIQTTSNAIDFGDLTGTRGYSGACAGD